MSEARVLPAGQGREGWLGALGIRFMISGEESGDEYSFVLQGRLGAKLGDKIVFAGPGDLVCKPRDQWHTFWNAGDEEAKLLEIISPAGFDHYFEEMIAISGGGRPDPTLAAPIRERHGLEIDMSSVAALTAEHGIKFG